jgi:CubicO group peptidase (beta-lactamase class C family)
MTNIRIITILVIASLLCSTLSLTAQKEVAAFKRAVQATTLLQNKTNLIPLQRLDTLQIGYMQIGVGQDKRFLDMAQRFTTIDPLSLPIEADSNWLQDTRASYNLLLLDIQDIAIGGQVPVAYRQKELIKSIIKSLNCVTLITGDGSIFQAMPWLGETNTLLIAPDRMKAAPGLAAQIIFGGMPAKGSLLGPMRSTRFKRGDGDLTTATRLGYAPAGYVDMDAQALDHNIKAIVEEGIQKRAFPGAQVLVAKSGKIIYHQAFGFHTYDNQQELSEEDVYDLASITKISAPLPALMKLHGEGKFDLDAPLKVYFPKFRFSNKGKLSYRKMLSHQAGLRPWIPYWRGTLSWNAKYPWQKKWDEERINDFNFRPNTFEQDSSEKHPFRVTDKLWLHKNYTRKIYKAIKKSPLREEEGYAYSGLLFYLLPEIIENITEQDYEQYLNEQFYHKLSAKLTYRPLDRYPMSRIVPTERDTFFRMQLLHGQVHDEGASMMSERSGNAGLFGTANGLAKLMALYLNEGAYGGEQLIASESVRTFTKRYYAEEGNRRALGFDKPLLEYDEEKSAVAESASPNSYGHSGYTGTFTWVDPEQELIYIFLCNRVYPSRTNRQIYELNIRPRIHKVIYDAIRP